MMSEYLNSDRQFIHKKPSYHDKLKVFKQYIVVLLVITHFLSYYWVNFLVFYICACF